MDKLNCRAGLHKELDSTWTWTNANARDWVIIVGAWSGRDTAATVTPVPTSVETAQTTPISVTLTGVTAASGDDVVFFADLDKTVNTDVWSSTPPASYSEQQDVDNGWSYGYLATRDNVTAGATGALTATATRTSGTGNAGFSGWVFSLPSSGGGGGGTTPLMGQACL